MLLHYKKVRKKAIYLIMLFSQNQIRVLNIGFRVQAIIICVFTYVSKHAY
jgi:hypothetical protein